MTKKLTVKIKSEKLLCVKKIEGRTSNHKFFFVSPIIIICSSINSLTCVPITI